jgi:hypothetical protein
MNGFFASGQMSSEEKQNILSQHKTIYDGYVTRHNQNLNPQPLYVQDFANDKEGLVVNNKGDVKTYTNVGINESTDEMKEDLGIENLKLGKKYKIKAPSYYEDDVEFTGETPFEDKDKSMYSFRGPKSSHSMGKKGVEDYIFDPEEEKFDLEEGQMCNECGMYEETCECWTNEMDEDLKESFNDQRNQITEMFNRFKNYN